MNKINKKPIKLLTPLNDEMVSKLKVGDVVTISGKMLTARDQAHKRIVEEGSPIDLNNSVIFHAGPIIKTKKNFKEDDLDPNNFELIAIGPTTSMRMNPYEVQVLNMGVKAIIGKGGMDDNVAKALIKNNSVYLVAVGGCAALYSDSVKNILHVSWLDLGIPEAIWQLNIQEFRPLIVAMDSHGGNIFKK